MVLNFVLGTAAELIKVYPVIRMAQERGRPVRILATGQSRENFLMQYRDFSLDEGLLTWMVGGQDLETSGSALKWFLRALKATRRSRARDLVSEGIIIVHGDTLSTLIGARLGKKAGLKVAHIEAGLRSRSLLNPFPEEITRRLVSRRASLHLAPDLTAEANLRRAHARGEILCTHGNTLLDAVRLAGQDKGPQASKPYVLANIHRYENLNSEKRWRQIIETLERVASSTRLIMVMHPQTRHRLQQDAEGSRRLAHHGVELRERMPFSSFIALLKGAEYLISDGGSNQEECSYLGKPCLLLREETERREGLENGCCVLSRFNPSVIDAFLQDPKQFVRPSLADSASPTRVIVQRLLQV